MCDTCLSPPNLTRIVGIWFLRSQKKFAIFGNHLNALWLVVAQFRAFFFFHAQRPPFVERVDVRFGNNEHRSIWVSDVKQHLVSPVQSTALPPALALGRQR